MADIQITLIDNSEKCLEELASKMRLARFAIGATAEGHAKELCPVDTGRLRNSISHAEDETDIYIGTNVEYAPYVELGANGRDPVHFLLNACTNYSDEYKQIAEDALKSE